VQQLAPEMTFDQARTFAQKACAWAGQMHNAWLFDRRGCIKPAQTKSRVCDHLAVAGAQDGS
jgi:hypothetical protein